MRVRRAIVMDTLATYVTPGKQRVKILDFGCGSGLLVDELSKKGMSVYGVDMSEEAIAFGKSRGIKGLSVLSSDHIDFPDDTFDAILMLDVLEHLEPVDHILTEVERILKPGGVMIIMVPAFMFLWGIQDTVSQHYRRYTKPTLSADIRRSTKLEPIRISYFNTFLFPPIALVRIVSSYFNLNKRESDFNLNSPMINKILFAIFNTERWFLQRIDYPFGVSILSVYRKHTTHRQTAPDHNPIKQVFRFIATGAMTAVLYLSISYILGTVLGIHYITTTIAAYTLALLFNFTVQKYWSFENKDSKGKTPMQAIRYIGWSVIGIAANTGMVYLLVAKMHLWYLIAQAVASCLFAAASFFAYRRIFRTKE